MTRSETVSDLARAVLRNVSAPKSVKPTLSSLTRLFEILFAASLKTEEGQPIICHFVYLNPSNPDPDPPPRIRRSRWNYVPLDASVALDVPSIVKLAKASDPRSSSVVVFSENHSDWHIWGLVDQGLSAHLYANRDAESGFPRPGLFQVSIEGLGHLVAYQGFVKIAELRVNTIVRSQSDVVWDGPINNVLWANLGHLFGKIKSSLQGEPDGLVEDATSNFYFEYCRSISRLLLRVKSHHHGGAVLIVPTLSWSHLRPKYTINYNRLGEAIREKAICEAKELFAEHLIHDDFIDEGSEIMPVGLYLEEAGARWDKFDTTEEIDGTLWFLSLLTRVDGAVVMTPDLTVHGFGVEIVCPEEPGAVYRAGDTKGLVKNLTEIHYEHFGTRHRSMMRFCNQVEGSVGFVVSQDGDIRAMTKVRRRLVVWDNIGLQVHRFEED